MQLLSDQQHHAQSSVTAIIYLKFTLYFGTLWFPGYLAKAKADLCKNPGKAQVNRPTLLRSLFTLGLLCKQFDFDSDVKPKNEVSPHTVKLQITLSSEQ